MEIDSATMKALNTRTRQEIIKLLQQRPYTASELSRILNKHVTTVAEHLETLESSGLIQRNEGRKWVYYNLTPKGSGIFNPSRTWSLVLSLSIISLFIGSFMLAQPQIQYSMEAMQISSSKGAAPAVAAPEALNIIPVIGTIIIVMAMLGFTYALVNRIRARTLRKQDIFYRLQL